MHQTTKTDFEFFFRLESLYNALTFSVFSPVVIPSSLGLSSEGKTHAFSYVYYDAAEDEKEASKIMKKRILLYRGNITEHLRFHARMIQDFDYINDVISRNDRESLSESARNLCSRVMNYSLFIKEHIKKAENDAFLHYPTCLPGHYFVMSGVNKFRELFFNPDQDMDGIIMDVGDLEVLAQSPTFKFLTMEIKDIKRIGEEKKPHAGLLDTSYEGKFNLTKELLKRAGYNYPGSYIL